MLRCSRTVKREGKIPTEWENYVKTEEYTHCFNWCEFLTKRKFIGYPKGYSLQRKTRMHGISHHKIHVCSAAMFRTQIVTSY